LQQETGGFTEFVPLPFVHMATPIFLQGRARRGPTFREAVLMHSVARLHYATLIDNIQVSWVKMGVEGSRRILDAGANDVGGTLMDENISRAAGASHGQEMDVDTLRALVEPLGGLWFSAAPSIRRCSRDELIEGFLDELRRDTAFTDERVEVLRALLVRFVELAMVDDDLGDLRVAVQALNELTEASTLFSQWRDVPKLAIFGSARTEVAHSLYEMARELGAAMAERDGWSSPVPVPGSWKPQPRAPGASTHSA